LGAAEGTINSKEEGRRRWGRGCNDEHLIRGRRVVLAEESRGARLLSRGTAVEKKGAVREREVS
jgi:hypothetical protein